jgi:hypothetical protein
MAHDRPAIVEHQRYGFAAAALQNRGMIMMVREVVGFGVAFVLSLALSVAVVELIWGLI